MLLILSFYACLLTQSKKTLSNWKHFQHNQFVLDLEFNALEKQSYVLSVYFMDDSGDWKNTRNGTFRFHRMMIDMGVNEIWKQENGIWTDMEVENDTLDERNNLVWEHGQVNEIQWDRCGYEKKTLNGIACDLLWSTEIFILPAMDNRCETQKNIAANICGLHLILNAEKKQKI